MELTNRSLHGKARNSWRGNDVGEGVGHYTSDLTLLVKRPSACATPTACSHCSRSRRRRGSHRAKRRFCRSCYRSCLRCACHLEISLRHCKASLRHQRTVLLRNFEGQC